MKHISAIVVAAGKGLRFKSKIPKPVVKLNFKPILIYSLEIISKHPLINEIILVINRENQKAIVREVKKYRINKICKVVKGGRRRQDSVLNGLKAVDKNTDFVLIHDAARPFIDSKVLSSIINEASRTGAAIAGVPVKATIKKATKTASKVIVKETLDRNNLWEIQTPQVFGKNLILKAFDKFGKVNVTDDAMLVEKLGRKVRIVTGSYRNIKITTPEDLSLAEAISKI